MATMTTKQRRGRTAGSRPPSLKAKLLASSASLLATERDLQRLARLADPQTRAAR